MSAYYMYVCVMYTSDYFDYGIKHCEPCLVSILFAKCPIKIRKQMWEQTTVVVISETWAKCYPEDRWSRIIALLIILRYEDPAKSSELIG